MKLTAPLVAINNRKCFAAYKAVMGEGQFQGGGNSGHLAGEKI